MKIYFAPVQGYTEAAYRNAHYSVFGGVDAYYTPFVRMEKGGFRNKDLRDIAPENNKPDHIVPQLIANDKTEAQAIVNRFISLDYKEIDINMGCPFPRIVNQGKGSGILRDTAAVKGLMDIVKMYPDILFSIKIRLGWEDGKEAFNLLPILNDAPLLHITLHPRLGKQAYKGLCDMDAFSEFIIRCKHPIIYNGDITTMEKAREIMDDFPELKGIMIGRGLLANPALALEIKNKEAMAHNVFIEKTGELHNKIATYYKDTLQGEAQLMSKLKTIWDYLLPDADKKLRKKIMKATRFDAYSIAVNELLRSY